MGGHGECPPDIQEWGICFIYGGHATHCPATGWLTARSRACAPERCRVRAPLAGVFLFPRAPLAFAFAGSRYRYRVVKCFHCLRAWERWLAVLLLLCEMVMWVPSLVGVVGGGLHLLTMLHIGVLFLMHCCTVAAWRAAYKLGLWVCLQHCEELWFEWPQLSKAYS
jgi:hypothetical protein